MVKRIVLRQLTRERASHHCLASRRRVPLAFEWLGMRWQVSLSRLFECRSGLESMAADWGGATLLIRTSRSAIAGIGNRVLDADIEPLLDGDLRNIVIEAAFSQLADRLESTTRKRFTLLDGDVPDDGRRNWFQFQLDDGQNMLVAEVGFDDLGLGFLAEAVRRVPAHTTGIASWGALPIPVQFMVGFTDLSIRALDELKRRDVIVLDESWVGPGTDNIVVNIGQRYAAAGILSGRTITLTEALEECMSEEAEHDLDGENALGKMSVRLRFDLGERSLTLDELMQIGPGHVFDLGRDIRKAVTIRANGRLVGEGELVDLDGQIGVAVLRLEPTA